VEFATGEEEGVLGVVQWMHEEDAQLVEHLDGPENKGCVRAVALLEVSPHGCRGEMEGKGASDDEHGRCVNVGEGQISDELGLNVGTDVREVGTEVVHVADSRAGCDGRLDLAEVFLGLSEEFFRFAVVGGGLALFGEGLQVWDEVEIAEALLALTGEIDRLHGQDLVIASGILSVCKGVAMRKVDLAMEEVSGGREASGMLANMLAIASLMPALSGLQ